jgi:hypothetical protein
MARSSLTYIPPCHVAAAKIWAHFGKHNSKCHKIVTSYFNLKHSYKYCVRFEWWVEEFDLFSVYGFYSMWPKVLQHVKKSLYNQPKPYFFKKLLPKSNC